VRKVFTLLGVLSLAFLAVACTETPVEPLADQVAPAPALNFMNGPAEAGPWVIREEFRQMVSSWYQVTPDGEVWIAWRCP